MKYQSLHGHTTTSDGVMSYEQVLDVCARNNVGVVSLTDHDSLIKPENFEKIKKLNHPVKYISGIEISCDYVLEISAMLSTFHIVGLFVDPTNKNLQDFCRQQLDGRRRRLTKYVKNLQGLGFKITEEEVLKFASDGGSIGRPHIYEALSQKPENAGIIAKFYEELKEKAKADPLRAKQVEECELRGERQKWFVLVLTPEGLHSAHVEYSEVGVENVSLDKVVRLIRGAGGLALIAHWSFLRDKFPLDVLEKIMKEERIDGTETVYAFGDNKPFLEDMSKLSGLCKKYNLVEGGGLDFHKPEDFQLLTDPLYAEYAKRTENLLEKILEKHPEIDKTWTTL